MTQANVTTGLEIAIIGMAGRFPGAETLEQFWQNLRDGVESISHLTDAELLASGVSPELLAHPAYVKAEGTISGVEEFDAAFFGFSPREAEILDPQQRCFLECAWTALEQAGYDAAQYAGAIGVYGGAAMNSYLLNLIQHPEIERSTSHYQLMLANDKDFLTTRVSYHFNLRGPSLDIQTACSTSLVAVHIACQSLLSGDCDMALAGGVSLGQPTGYLYQPGGIYSPDGHCRAFAAEANGTVAGNGLGVVVLKRLQEALTNGDRIYAVIKGSAINNDGGNKVSFTAPQIDSQAAVIRAAQVMAEVEPDTITYVEAHGTGTALGDPIELAALTQSFRLRTPEQAFCAIGSVKSNIGHLDAAAGIASLIKIVLALHHRQIPPSLHGQRAIAQLAGSPFYLNTALTDWRSPTQPLRAGVSSFGIGGTNAHVILEAAPAPVPATESRFTGRDAPRSPQLLVLSAKTPTALQTAATNLSQYLQQHPTVNLADVAYTLQVGRRAWEYRWSGMCSNVESATQQLANLPPASPIPASPPGLVWLFPGQGSQYVDMGRELYETEPTFCAIIDRGCDQIQAQIGIDLRSLLYPRGAKDLSSIHQTQYAQPALFLVEYALAQLWLSWGVQPDALMGHSIGEYVTATLAGVWTFEAGLSLVVTRSQLMQTCSPGVMLSVALTEAEVMADLEQFAVTHAVSLAARNAPQLCVVSGLENAIAHLEATWIQRGIACRRLPTSHAFHSHLMEPVLSPFREALQQVALQPPKLPIVSNLTGTWLTADQATNPNYWIAHLRHPVRFAEGIATVMPPAGDWIGLEVGAGNTLNTLVKQQFPDRLVVSCLRHPRQESSDQAMVQAALGQLWQQGISIPWQQRFDPASRQRLPLPTYPFERQRYWIDRQAGPRSPASRPLPHSAIPPSSDWFYLPCWERIPQRLDPTAPPLEHHCWLILLDPVGLGDHLAQTLQAAGQDVITVRPGDRFDQTGYRTFTAHPEHLQDWVELLEDLQLRELVPTQIVHGWTLTPTPSDPNPLSGFYSLLHLSQAILANKITTPMQIMIVANHTQSVLGTEPLIPLKATILGLAKVINQEVNTLTCRCLDLDLPNSNAAVPTLSRVLLTHLLTPHPNPIAACRGHYLWQPSFQSQSLPLPEAISLRDRGCYLVMGDLTSGLGPVWIKLLTRTTTTCWVLSPDPLPPEIAQVHPATLKYQCLDLNDQAAVSAAIAELTHTSNLHGIFYATPMSEQLATLIPQLSQSTCEATWQTKLQSILVLAEVLQNQSLDFCLVQSSLSSVLGGLGLGAYAAANAAIDAVALHQSQTTGVPWISVNWDAWRDGTNAETPDSNTTFGAELATLALTTAEIDEATRRILAHPTPQIVVSKGALSDRLERWVTRPLTSGNQVGVVTSVHPRPTLSTTYVAPQTQIEQAIAEIWQTLLGVEAIGIDDSFFELGGHSLLAVQAISRLRDRFAVELPLRDLLETPTVKGVAAIVVASLPTSEELTVMADVLAEIQELSPEEVQRQAMKLSDPRSYE